MGELARAIGRPVVFSLVQTHTEPDRYRAQLDRCAQLQGEGALLFPQVANRTTGILIGVDSRLHAFSTRPSYRAIAHLPVRDRVARMRDPEVKARILAEPNEWAPDQAFAHFLHETFDRMYEIGDPIDWEPAADDAIGPRARRAGRDPQDLLYDLFTADDGDNLVMFPYTNYSYGNLDAVHEMLTDPTSVFGLGDAGAHCGIACDGSSPTLMLEHWTRERTRGPLIPLPIAIRMMTSETATPVRDARPRRDRAGLPRRPQRDRPRVGARVASRARPRSSRRWSPGDATSDRLPRDRGRRRDHLARRRADRCDPRSAGSWRTTPSSLRGACGIPDFEDHVEWAVTVARRGSSRCIGHRRCACGGSSCGTRGSRRGVRASRGWPFARKSSSR